MDFSEDEEESVGGGNLRNDHGNQGTGDELASIDTKLLIKNQNDKGTKNSSVDDDPPVDDDYFQFHYSDEDGGKDFEETMKYMAILKLVKIFAYIITFILVLGSTIVSKLSLLAMTSMLNKEVSICSTKTVAGSTSTTTTTSRIQVSQEENIYWTWILFIGFSFPEICTFIRSARIYLFKGQKRLKMNELWPTLISECLHTIGLAVLVYIVLPSVDSIKGLILTTSVCLIPACGSLLSADTQGNAGKANNRHTQRNPGILMPLVTYILNILAILFQASALVLWILFYNLAELKIANHYWCTPIALILISFGWWQNYTFVDSTFRCQKNLATLKPKFNVNDCGYTISLIVSLCKIGVFFILMIITYFMKNGESLSLFSKASDAFGYNTNNSAGASVGLDLLRHPLFYNIICGGVAYLSAKYACQICIQKYSFSTPIILTIPLTLMILYCLENNPCLFASPFIGSFGFNLPADMSFVGFFTQHHWVLIPLLLSQYWITKHIFIYKTKRLANTEEIFLLPMYNGFLIDQSLALNKRQRLDGQDEDKGTLSRIYSLVQIPNTNIVHLQNGELVWPDEIPKIKACATMWHEGREEMLQLMKSIFRMDEDYCAKKNAVLFGHFDMYDIGFYLYETHIFFDDAFKPPPPNSAAPDTNPLEYINEYVSQLINVIQEVGKNFHDTFIQIRPSKNFITPYGLKMEWTLPGKTALIVHLKDKTKIRHKKRWSQCMYMTYLLEFQINKNPSISARRKEIIAQNTFLLALDGDVDFQPKAVELLVDRMKKNDKLGGVCGRIHPIGSGPMVWYQKFEYATGHWLQKATEHLIGCVLCSPGCFSLFRGRALLNNAVLGKYIKPSTKAAHYVQYDQGEDRWLCTLLLQQGHRVNYCAAADALTHAPEEFNEFYNQRKRWVPSTAANLLDLLSDSTTTIKNNPDISIFFIAYQFILMFGTILGPGTIFLLLVGACITVLGISPWISFILNLIPLLMFSFICYFCTSKIQLKTAQVLSGMYCLLMVAVLVGIFVQIGEDGLLAPSCLFFLVMSIIYIATGFLHPLEFNCLAYGIIYYFTIPSMYLLLIIFCAFNLNDVSWGTRETTTNTTKTKKKGLLGILRNDEEFPCLISFFNWISCKKRKQNDKLKEEPQNQKCEIVEKPFQNENATCNGNAKEMDALFNKISYEEKEDDASLLTLNQHENEFWTKLIQTYLSPTQLDPVKEATIKSELKSLRNSSVVYFLLANGIFILFIFLLELKKESVRIKWPFGGGNQDDKLLYLEPIGFTFVAFFIFVLIFQFITILFHRFETISHILASTDLHFIQAFRREGKIAKLKREATIEKQTRKGLVKSFNKVNGKKKMDSFYLRGDCPYDRLDKFYERGFKNALNNTKGSARRQQEN